VAIKVTTYRGEIVMARVGVRELKNRTTEIIRDVRENQAEYVVTYHGKPVAVLLPIDEEWLESEARRAAEAVAPGDDVWAELVALRQEIGRSWQSEKTAVEMISEQRE
jgi:prevent-host-death family protein